MSYNLFRSLSIQPLPTVLSADHRDYNQGTQNGTPSASISGKTNNDSVIVASNPVRFKEFYKFLENIEAKVGTEEPLIVKNNRPFLLSHEATVSKTTSLSRVSKLGHGKGGKGKKGRRKGNNHEKSVIFTLSKPPPALNSYSASNKPYKLSQAFETVSYLTSSVIAIVTFQLFITFSQLSQYIGLTAIFDQYKITCIEIWLTPQKWTDQFTFAGGALHTVVDYDDTVALGSVAAALSYPNCITSPAGEGVYRKFIPHIALAAFDGGFASYTNVSPQWIDTASPGVEHFGVKGILPITPNAVQIYDLNVRVHFELQNVK